MQGLKRLLNTIDMVKEHNNPDLKLCGVLVTMYDRRTVHAAQVQQRIQQHFKDQVFNTVIDRCVDFDYATVAAQPLTVENPRSRGAVAYRKLAQEVIDSA